MVQSHRQQESTPVRRKGASKGVKFVLLVAFVSLILPALLIAAGPLLTSLVFWFARVDEGVPFDRTRARQVVAECGDALSRVKDLRRGGSSPTASDTSQELADELGALDVRIEDRPGGPWAIVVFHRFGLPEIYEDTLTWLPEAAARQVRAGGYRLGEYREYIDYGWWWVEW